MESGSVENYYHESTDYSGEDFNRSDEMESVSSSDPQHST